MHRVLVNGPIEHHHLILVLLNVADWADTDIDEHGHAISQVAIAARCGISLRYCRTLMTGAVTDGWLAVTRKPRPGRPGLWKLGPNLAQPRAGSARSFPNDAQPPRATSRKPRTKKHIDVDVSLRREPAPPDGRGVRTPARRDGASRTGPPAPDTHVPPGPPPPVDIPNPNGLNRDPDQADKQFGHDHIAMARAFLASLPASPADRRASLAERAAERETRHVIDLDTFRQQRPPDRKED